MSEFGKISFLPNPPLAYITKSWLRFNSRNYDQKRTLTPKQAFKNGSNWLVIGRPITKGNIDKNFKTLIDHLSK